MYDHSTCELRSFDQQLEDPNLRKIITLEDTNLARASIPTYRSYLNTFFNWAEIKDETEMIKISDEKLQVALEEFVKYQNGRVKADLISPNTVPKIFKPIKLLLEANYRDRAVVWKRISMQYPEPEKTSGGKPWTTDNIQVMLKHCQFSREYAMVHFHGSTGCRIGVHDHPLLMRHLIPMEAPNGKKCYAILVYATQAETIEEKDVDLITGKIDTYDYSHFVFLTPEATISLDDYLNYRKKRGEVFNDMSPIFSTARKDAKDGSLYQLTGNGYQKLFQRVLARTPLQRNKRRNRFDIMIDHGFRKRFNTILKINNDVNSNIAEKLMQHKKGLDGSYLTPTRQQCFAEFVKAVYELTIDAQQRQENIIEDTATENTFLKSKIRKIEEQLASISSVEKSTSKLKLTPEKEEKLVKFLQDNNLF